MTYHVVDPADLEVQPNRPSEMRYISDATDMENLGLRVYDVAPGEDIPLSGLHYHDEQEEVFYVAEGKLAVETPDRVYHVDDGQFFIAEPESPHRAYNDSDAHTRVIGIGAPPVSDAHPYEE
jgi:mannose-6-phosphate isomerase-like protein (cupin superfamily)